MTLELSDVEIRVLGCLIEKELTTPEYYPLTTNALMAACNQKSNRDPVVAYEERDVDAAMLRLREEGLARTVKGSGRAFKHKHIVAEALGLGGGEVAVLGVLALRGPQTVGEIRGRTERAHEFVDLDEVEHVLQRLADRDIARRLERAPGQKEARWMHLLGGEAPLPMAAPDVVAAPAPAPRPDVPDLEADVDELRRLVEHLYDVLGEPKPE